jgi:hypothetical protein
MTSTPLTTALCGALAILPAACDRTPTAPQQDVADESASDDEQATLNVPATAAHADFTGTWVLDESRSKGLPEGMGETTMKVAQSGDRIEVELEWTTPMGEQRLSDVYVLDGKQMDFRPPVPSEVSATGTRTSRWSEGQSGFEATERATLQGPEGEVLVTAARTWALAPGGETLTIEMTVSGPQGEMKSTRVFIRQKPAAG